MQTFIKGDFHGDNESSSVEELIRLASDFVTSQKGMWDHAAWVDFLSGVKQKGIAISDEMQSKLGELLEAMKASPKSNFAEKSERSGKKKSS